MPRKNNKTPEVRSLLRENQRRSRARQKELMEDMRQRLREYETQGVQATLDMQSAARTVAAENRCLRALLAEHGVAGDAVDDYLRKSGIGPAAIPAAKMPAVYVAPQETPCNTVSSASASPAVSQCTTSRAASPGTLMDCDVAASIVADLHGHGDHSLARSTLGCTTGSCSVKTTQVFTIIDRAT
ncbi:hypothetical protein HMPREF1624_08155 [Sporothrix schenckii ATCC 58251]|uniref:BZIP domain-containing protein n=1 Tax=Sporothrix schenckii (strain ATCC 58251 / de Perez 2211183) TaxID=1391915 RepID=U7PI50_SPOS1|nr:hypothetical protein HMPREF1624_08155 [Sporothrix schenckii ATCC 58251]